KRYFNMKAQSFAIRTLKHQIQACLRLIALHVRSAILRLIDLENQLEVAMNQQLDNKEEIVSEMIRIDKELNKLPRHAFERTQEQYDLFNTLDQEYNKVFRKTRKEELEWIRQQLKKEGAWWY
ncbi:MAG: hypothetical protein ACKPH3_24185, partial [Dolichospermum sp.]